MIEFDLPPCFGHHRSGWQYCIEGLQNQFPEPHVIRCISYADGHFGRGEHQTTPWIGFVHNTENHPDFYETIYTYNNSKNGATTPLSKLCKLPNFVDALGCCFGLFTLTKTTRLYLEQQLKIRINDLVHASETPSVKFSYELFKKNDQKMIISIGHWLRNFESFSELNSKYQKAAIDVVGIIPKLPHGLKDTVILPRLNNEDYDACLSNNLVFLDLYDVAACNTIIECIVRDTPIITRRLPASEEYLGANYPLFFDSIEQAEQILSQDELIVSAHEYLKEMDKTKYSKEHFQQTFVKSQIVRSIRMAYGIQ